jgi:stage II sporulation protein P
VKGKRPYRTALRRGIGLGLALVAAWGVSLTADPVLLGERLTELGERSGLAVHLLSGQLGYRPAGEEQALEGWGRLLLGQSAFLAAGESAVVERRTQQGRQPEEPLPQEGDGDDQEEPNLKPQAEEDGIVEMTAQGKTGGQYLYGAGVYLYNRTGYDLDASVLEQGEVQVELGDGPQILIVHTHGSEAYSQTDGDVYEESDPYRTTDCTHNVVRVGEEMATVFRAHGFQVLHDTTLYDYPAYNGAYERSKAAVEQWLADYPSIQIVLDVHRDALVGSNGEVYKLVSTEAGQKVSQVMLVVGTDDGGANHPNWKNNLSFAVKLQQELVRGYASLARPIVLRSSSYNQQLAPGYLLVEVGGHGNTLTEALDGARMWADNVARTLLTLEKK